MTNRIGRLIADATDALNCAELFARKAQGSQDNVGPRDPRVLRDRELDRAAAYIDKLKDELRAEGIDLS